MTKEDIQKSINEILDEAWTRMQSEMDAELGDKEVEKSETKDEEKVEKAEEEKSEVVVEKSETEEDAETTDEKEEGTEEESVEKGAKQQEKKNENANGGKDEIKSGTPKCDQNQPMRKSEEELSEILTEDELEVVKAWREEIGANAEETVAKSQGGLSDTPDIVATIKEAVQAATDEFKKSLNEKDDLIKSMNEKIEKMASAPAYDKRSVDSLEVIEKGSGDAPPLSKAHVLDTMLDLQKSGKGVTSHHVAEFESTGNISNPQIANLVKNACK